MKSQGHSVRGRASNERAALLAQIDPELRREVESLLIDRQAASLSSGRPSTTRRNCWDATSASLGSGRMSGSIPRQTQTR